jgi:cytochrome c oxidase subunit 1
MFNFDEVPTVVGHPYEYGVPGARHGIFKEPEPVVATVGAPAEEAPAEGAPEANEPATTDGDE